MSKNKDTQLIWESYQTNLNEAEEFSMDKLVYMGEEQFNKMRGKADHEEIIRDIEKTYLEFFNHNHYRFFTDKLKKQGSNKGINSVYSFKEWKDFYYKLLIIKNRFRNFRVS